MKNKHQLAQYLWFEHPYYFWLLWPLCLLYGAIVWIRHQLYQRGILKSYRSAVPVVVVGNLTVGGNGKTPTVIWLIEQLTQRGIEVGVITRGYGAKAPYTPLLVSDSQNATQTGDEPLLIYRRTGAPVVLSPNRQAAIELLLSRYPSIQLIISDDGLQHYALKRDIEWVVIDAKKRFGNGWWLPAGPMRERQQRLKSVDAILFNYGSLKTECLSHKQSVSYALSSQPIDTSFYLAPLQAVNLLTQEKKPLTDFSKVIALAGIGFPERFFRLLTDHQLILHKTASFTDHHRFQEADLTSLTTEDDLLPILMTEKDAMKCLSFAKASWWFIPIDAVLSQEATNALLDPITRLIQDKSPAPLPINTQ